MRGVEITNLKASDPSDTDDPIKVDFDVTDYNYFDWSAPNLNSPCRSRRLTCRARTRTTTMTSRPMSPSSSERPRRTQAELKLTFPAKYKLRIPIPVDVKRDYAEYHSVYSYEGNQFTSKRTLKFLVREIPQSRSRRLCGLPARGEVRRSAGSFAGEYSAGTSAAGGSESAGDLNGAAMQAMNNQRYDLAIDLLQRVVKLDPKYKSAWDNLGRAYLSLGKDDEAGAGVPEADRDQSLR